MALERAIDAFSNTIEAFENLCDELCVSAEAAAPFADVIEDEPAIVRMARTAWLRVRGDRS